MWLLRDRFRAEVIDQHPLMTLYFPIHFANNFHCVDVSMPKRNPYGFQNPHELHQLLEATKSLSLRGPFFLKEPTLHCPSC